MATGKKTFLYQTVYNDLRSKIENSEIKSGDRLSNEAALQAAYQVSRDTVRKALSKLEADGYIQRTPALGTFVRRTKSDYPLFKMKSFSEQMQEKGIVPSSELLSIELTSRLPKSISEALALTAADRCYIISRIRKGDGDPMSYEKTYVPYKLCPDLQMYLNDKASLYRIYEDIYRLCIGYGKIRLEAEMPSAEIQELLKIPKGSPLLKMHCICYLENGIPLYCVESDYIGNKYFFSAEIPR